MVSADLLRIIRHETLLSFCKSDFLLTFLEPSVPLPHRFKAWFSSIIASVQTQWAKNKKVISVKGWTVLSQIHGLLVRMGDILSLVVCECIYLDCLQCEIRQSARQNPKWPGRRRRVKKRPNRTRERMRRA